MVVVMEERATEHQIELVVARLVEMGMDVHRSTGATRTVLGVVGVVAPDEPALLGLVTLLAPVIVSGNTVVALASEARPYPAVLLGEMLATSDLPGGVVNLLTGFRRELLPTFATHAHLRAISAVAEADERRTLRLGAAESVKRVRFTDGGPARVWLADAAQGVHAIRDFVEFKTVWHPIGA